MKTKILLIFMFICLSCTSIKVKQHDFDSTQKLVGKIKLLIVEKSYYYTNGEEITSQKESSENYFDEGNRIIKQISTYPKLTTETTFYYNKNLLKSKISISPDLKYVTTYSYDKNKNVIEKKQFWNDTLDYGELSKYDSNNNLIELRKLRIDIDEIITEKLSYDYRKKTRTFNVYYQNGKTQDDYYLIQHFDEKGFVVKSEFINKENKVKAGQSEMTYDKLGNLLSRTNIDKTNKKDSIIYKNTYDRKGNIIVRDKFFNNKLVEKNISKITYW